MSKCINQQSLHCHSNYGDLEMYLYCLLKFFFQNLPLPTSGLARI